nr:T7-like tail tubular protein B [uncultured Mediterranean phage uvMED]
MANITQTIPNLAQGISQQPDEYKIPGQVKDMVNALPDVSQGLTKRPAGKFVASLSDGSNNSTTNGRWFHYYRDENEQYIGQIAQNGVIKMWDCLSGAEKTVVNGIGNNNYLTHTDDEDIQTLTLNDFTYLTNRSKTTAMDTAANTLEPDTNFKKEIFLELKSISYAKQYSVNIFDNNTTSTVTTATRINVERLRSSNNYCESGGHMVDHAARGTQIHRCTEDSLDGRDAFAPNVGTKIFSIDSGITLVDEGAVGGEKTDGSITDRSYSYSVSVYNSSNQSGQSGRKNLYFRIATTGQSTPYGAGSNVTYQARYTTTYDLLHGGEGWQQGDYFYVWMKDAFYKVTIETISTSVVQGNLALVRPQPTPFDTETTITAESILGDIRSAVIASGNFSASDITTIGTGMHIKRSSVFNASTPVGELLNVVAGKINDVGDLPSQCKHGMVVEIVNSAADEDNHFVKFFGNSDRDGEGTWEECAKPGRKKRIQYSTMPVVLIRTADGNFRLTELDGSSYTISGVSYTVPQWDDALVGDDITNPEPSFIGKQINKMLFFRNRLCLLSDENIILSRPGDFYNFFNKSAIQFVASDPIDIAASSEYPAILYDGIQVNTGLVLFTKNQQFMLTTDSDIFSPTTAKINALSSYNFNFATNPISLGTTVGFLDNAGKFSRFFEMTNVLREGEPQVIEQSAVVSKLFEKDLKLISNSRENSVVFFSEEGSSTLYGYRYFDQIEDRKLASWFKWTVTGTIQYHCMQDDNLYVVVRNNNKDQLLKYSIKMDSNTFALAENRVHLDHLMSTSGWSYNATTRKSTKAKPTGLESANQLAAYDVDTGNNLGRYGLITINGSNLELDGDWSGETFLIGYQYTMEVNLPTIYFLTQSGTNWKADTRANTILHRVKFGFGPVGIYETTLSRTGRVDYTEVFEVASANQYVANTGAIADDNILRTVPIYDRNINVALTLKSTHPAPATVHNMTWEGVYTKNNYERV